MKKNKKILLILGSIILLIAFVTTVYVVITTPDKTTTLTALEKRWVEQNKNKMINIAVLNDIPLYGSEGKGIFFTFLNDFEDDINLKFNKIPYTSSSEPSLDDYRIEKVDKLVDNQILIYKDYYVALSNDKNTITSINDFENKKIGTLNSKIDDITYYITNNTANCEGQDNIDDLFDGLAEEEYNYIIIPYNMYLDKIIENGYNIVYNFEDVYDNYVLTLSKENETVNTIMKKYMGLWKETKLSEEYNNEFNTLYYENKNVSNKSQADFKGKIYTYGYINNLPFENVANEKLTGINGEYINSFINLTGIEIKYKKYNSTQELKEAFNKSEIDIMFNNFNTLNDIKDYKTTYSPYNSDYVVLTPINVNKVVDSIKSLKDERIYTIKNSTLVDYVNKNVNAQVKTFENNKNLFNNLSNDMIVVIDYETYNYYKDSELQKYRVVYHGKTNNNYNFIIKDNDDNKVLAEMLDYYVSSLNYKSVKNNAYQNLIINPKNETTMQTIINYILYIVLPILVVGSILYVLFNRKKQQNEIKKDNKLRYIDMMTSLKNRNYLNANIKEWDEGKVYPQTIVIIDLNNVQYINDNFGHEEGDNVIKAAANILIKTQMPNTDIIRTDGNEFLIYLIGYSENEVISYMKKLYKEMKDLPHGFGAAFGYSMITDDIKLIDDAINEATLDMRTNKES